MPIIDLVKWDAASDDIFALKYPSNELSTWTQLIVAESQEAVLVNQGKMIGPFGPGRHTLDTANYPFLATFFSIPFGGKSPFTAQVWYVNKAVKLDVKWGTATAMMVKDPVYNIILPVRAFGQFGITVLNTRKFLTKLVGTLPSFDSATVSEYFKGILISRIKDVIAKRIVNDKISLLEISAHLTAIGADLQAQLTTEFEEFGLGFVKFTVMSINTPEDDPSVERLKEALARKAELDILGTNYQQVASFEVMQTAAANEGAGMMAAPMMGAGMGLGMGAAMGSAFGQAAAQVAPAAPAPVAPAVSAPITHPCDKCANPLLPDAKFCPKCGDFVNRCQACGADNPDGASRCVKCSAAMPIPCPGCKKEVPSTCAFCPHCGIPTKKKCAKCSEVLPPGAAFCMTCGTKA